VAVPAFNDYLLPVLTHTADGAEHTVSELTEAVAKHFALTTDDLAEILPSGTQPRHQNRVYWARTYLTKAGLLDAVGRGRVRITPRGKELLTNKPARIDRTMLNQYAEFRTFAQHTATPDAPSTTTAVELETPEERLESNYQALREDLSERLLAQVKRCRPPSSSVWSSTC
jgi:restriction system protein